MNIPVDDEHMARVRALMRFDQSAEELLASEASADQLLAAEAYSRKYHCVSLPGKQQFFYLSTLDVVRDAVGAVMLRFRLAGSEQWKIEEYEPRQLGTRVPSFNIGNPDHMSGVFVLFADDPDTLHTTRFDSVEDIAARRHLREETCHWGVHTEVFCEGYASEYLCFSRCSIVVVVPTCLDCKKWLVAGAPLRQR